MIYLGQVCHDHPIFLAWSLPSLIWGPLVSCHHATFFSLAFHVCISMSSHFEYVSFISAGLPRPILTISTSLQFLPLHPPLPACPSHTVNLHLWYPDSSSTKISTYAVYATTPNPSSYSFRSGHQLPSSNHLPPQHPKAVVTAMAPPCLTSIFLFKVFSELTFEPFVCPPQGYILHFLFHEVGKATSPTTSFRTVKKFWARGCSSMVEHLPCATRRWVPSPKHKKLKIKKNI